MKTAISTKKLALLGMFTALVFASNYARIILPVPVGGVPSFTLANIVCVLSGLLLGPVGGLASGLGSALYDLTNPLWASECWLTFLIKGGMGLGAGLVAGRGVLTYRRGLMSAVAGCVVCYVLYFTKALFYNGMLLGGLPFDAAALTLLTLIVPSVFNGGIAILVAPPLSLSLTRALRRAGLEGLYATSGQEETD